MDKNLFGIGPKGMFWLRLTSNTSALGSIVSIVTESGGKWGAAGLALLGLVCNAVASGNPSVKA
jgi:hypothetical protein